MTDSSYHPHIGLTNLAPTNSIIQSVETEDVAPYILAGTSKYNQGSYLSVEIGEKLSRLGYIASVSLTGIGLIALQQERVEAGGLLLMLSMNLGLTAYAVGEDAASKRRLEL